MRNLDGELSRRNLAGSLLVAHPNMLDPNFRRTVLFISAHDPNERALGVIISRPLDRQVAELLTQVPPASLAEVPGRLGGPVRTNPLLSATLEWEKRQGRTSHHHDGWE